MGFFLCEMNGQYMTIQFSGRLVIHDFGHPETNEILYAAEKAEIEEDESYEYLLIHPTDKTALSVYEVNNFLNAEILNLGEKLETFTLLCLFVIITQHCTEYY